MTLRWTESQRHDHPDLADVVQVRHCPWRHDWTQEVCIMEAHGHYQNQTPLVHPRRMPYWLQQGMALVSSVQKIQMELKREAAAAEYRAEQNINRMAREAMHGH